MMASGVPTGTFAPGCASSVSTTPSSNTSISIAPFSVSTTAMMSPRATAWPGWRSHSTSVPASIAAPSDGILNSAMGSVGARQATSARAAATMAGTCGTAASSRCFG
jgi:hypothetical protein